MCYATSKEIIEWDWRVIDLVIDSIDDSNGATFKNGEISRVSTIKYGA